MQEVGKSVQYFVLRTDNAVYCLVCGHDMIGHLDTTLRPQPCFTCGGLTTVEYREMGD